MFVGVNPRRQGDLGEFSAIQWLVERGHPVWLPLGHSPDVDLVTRIDGQLVGVQVKTSTVLRHGRYEVTICTRGGNQSWNGLVKRFRLSGAIGSSSSSPMAVAGSSPRKRSAGARASV
jgi:hypothetical protein